ncbi:Bug family tripartite tricarboxylate transporter substrate binding protein [Ramlibacter sp.]|uniref:Bug family tripartite tricarboxylate transporter substrate binding protein n=1 Tax=Ramlibacter sp. TaxID=1917967 RepID=UPI003D12F418
MKHILRRSWLRMAALGCAAFALSAGTAQAQDWPQRPVKIVIAQAAGSSGDTLARLLAPKLEAIWKQPVIVENRTGAGGIVGTEFAANATDNHTLLLASASSYLPKYTTKALRYDPFTDLQPIYKVIAYQYVLVTNAETAKKAKNLREFVALSKQNPLFFSGLGRTAIFNISMAIINKSIGVNYTPVDFNAVTAMNLALLRNDTQFLVNTPSSVAGQMDAGTIVPLAVISNERYANLPNVPTLAEAVGYKDYVPQIWAGMLAPKSLPKNIVDKVARDLGTIYADAEGRKQIETKISGAMLRSSPAQFDKEVREEAGHWQEVFKAMNFVPE